MLLLKLGGKHDIKQVTLPELLHKIISDLTLPGNIYDHRQAAVFPFGRIQQTAPFLPLETAIERPHPVFRKLAIKRSPRSRIHGFQLPSNLMFIQDGLLFNLKEHGKSDGARFRESHPTATSGRKGRDQQTRHHHSNPFFTSSGVSRPDPEKPNRLRNFSSTSATVLRRHSSSLSKTTFSPRKE